MRHNETSSPGREPDEPFIGSPDNPRTAAMVAYITVFGWLISYFALYNKGRNPLAAFHLRQSLLIHIISFLLQVVFSFTLYAERYVFFIVAALSVGLFIIWLMGFLDALNGRAKAAPILGRLSQRLFRRI